jgi:Protein of unknown function (DUF402)
MGSGAYRRPGERIVRRDVWRGRPVGAWAGNVVLDDPGLLALWMPGESPLTFTDDFFGAPHPWSGRDHWYGHGVLQLQRPGDAYAVWHGVGEHLDGWYINLQEPFRRTARGIDTLDNVLDIVVGLDGSWYWKDAEELDEWVARGRYTAEEVAAIRAEGERVARDLDAGRRWWSDEWLAWKPDPNWPVSELPSDRDS